MNPLIDKEQRLRFLIKNLKSVIFAYADRHTRIADALGAAGWQKLKQLIDATTAAEGEEELTHALTLNREFVLFLKQDKLVEINLRKTLGNRGSVYLSNLIDLAM